MCPTLDSMVPLENRKQVYSPFFHEGSCPGVSQGVDGASSQLLFFTTRGKTIDSHVDHASTGEGLVGVGKEWSRWVPKL